MRQPLSEGRWFAVQDEEQHKILKQFGQPDGHWRLSARVQIGTYAGPGYYLVLQYSQPCPRGCCRDSVSEVLSAQDVASQVADQMRDLAGLLKRAREYAMVNIMSSVKDLRTWVEEHIGSDVDSTDVDRVTEAIQSIDEHPPWGTDWADFLGDLPDPLIWMADL